MPYTVIPISIETKEERANQCTARVRYELKSDIYGCCIKLLTDSRELTEQWSDNFYNMSQSIRSHGRLFVFSDTSEKENTVYYDRQSKTAFLFNFRYYGWIKSIALSIAGDILEDEHDIYSVHGACLDTECGGVAILGASGAGKTTHTYGLLRDARVRVISDDWFFARVYGRDILAYGSEKNFYIRADLAQIWPEFADLVSQAQFDPEGRAIVDLRSVVGKGRILPLTTIRVLIILQRDADEPQIKKDLDPRAAMAVIKENAYFNPHLLVKDGFKTQLRDAFFHSLLARARIVCVNTIHPPEQIQHIIRETVGLYAEGEKPTSV
ncbi:MAG: aldolase [Methanomicrobiales archaeon]|nr:aldolase [Methanomicrobiales archaeon]